MMHFAVFMVGAIFGGAVSFAMLSVLYVGGLCDMEGDFE